MDVAQVAQMRRGLLPYCVLAMLRDTERYGFDLVQALGAVGGVVTSQGTIYPLLARLRLAGPGGYHLAGIVRLPRPAAITSSPRRDKPHWLTSPGSGPSSKTASMLFSAPERRTRHDR